jgi:hypothetical protein
MTSHDTSDRRRRLIQLSASSVVVLALGSRLLAPRPRTSPAVGGWATCQWTSSVSQESVLVREQTPAARPRGRSPGPRPAAHLRDYTPSCAATPTYVLQIVTQKTLDGPPLSTTQVTIDRATGKATKSVIQRPKGPIATPESGLRPFRRAAVKGTDEAVAVPAGRFPAVRAPYQSGTVWVSDQVPALGLVRATFPNGHLELVKSGTTGAKDLLRS